jgi:hypothetical protein
MGSHVIRVRTRRRLAHGSDYGALTRGATTQAGVKVHVATAAEWEGATAEAGVKVHVATAAEWEGATAEVDDALRRLLAAGAHAPRRHEARMAQETREQEAWFLHSLPRWVPEGAGGDGAPGSDLVGDSDGEIHPARFFSAAAEGEGDRAGGGSAVLGCFERDAAGGDGVAAGELSSCTSSVVTSQAP